MKVRITSRRRIWLRWRHRIACRSQRCELLAREARLHQPLHQAVGCLAHEHGIRFGQGLQTSGEIHGIAETMRN
jgi:hypothetical protein